MDFVMDLSLLSKILPVIFLFIIGHWFNRTGFITQNSVGELKKLVVNVFLPSLLFISFSKSNFEARYLIIVVTVFIACTALLGMGIVIKKMLKIQSPYFPTLLTGFEAGMLGYSLYAGVFGAENVFKFAVIDLGQVTFVFFILVSLLVQYKEGRKSGFFSMFSSFAKNPVIIAIFLGIIMQKTRLMGILQSIPFTQALLQTLSMLSSLTVPLICLVIGYEIKFEKGSVQKSIQAIGLRYILLLPLAIFINSFIISSLLGLDRAFSAALMTMFTLPPPFIIPLYISDENLEEKQFVFNTISLSTIVSIIMFLIVIGTNTG